MDELRPGKPVTVADLTIVPIERRVLHTCAGDGRFWLVAFMEAAAVLVRDVSGIRAFDVEGVEIAVESLVGRVPGLGSLLASWSH